MRWQSIHVYYYDDDKDALILDAVRPLFERLAGGVGGAHYTRHWRRGPHLRINVLTEPDAFAAGVWEAAEEIVGGFLRSRPSTSPLVPADHVAMHERLAVLEGETGPLTPWFPDNTMRVEPYDARLEILGSQSVADLLADFYTATTPLAFEMTERAATPNRRLAAAFDLMIATVHALSGAGVDRGFTSFRSHAEAFLAGWPEGAGLRGGWDEHYRRHAASLAGRVRAVVAAVDDPARPAPFVRDWINLLIPVRERGVALLADGGIPAPESGPAGEAELARLSPYHAVVYGSDWWPTAKASQGFAIHRLMLNLLYLHLTRQGLTPVDRFLLCHLAANAVEDCYGVSAYELAGGTA